MTPAVENLLYMAKEAGRKAKPVVKLPALSNQRFAAARKGPTGTLLGATRRAR